MGLPVNLDELHNFHNQKRNCLGFTGDSVITNEETELEAYMSLESA